MWRVSLKPIHLTAALLTLLALVLCLTAEDVSLQSLRSHNRYVTDSKPQKLLYGRDDTSSNYVFDATSKQNLAVYFGSTNATSTTTLLAQCSDPNIDIVILGFILSVLGGGGGYPELDFGTVCTGQNAAMEAAGATGLLSCTSSLAPMISECQALGKKVLVSVGGALGNVTFQSSAEATSAASMLWDVFGAGTGIDGALRPFGEDVTVDGFDLGRYFHSPSN